MKTRVLALILAVVMCVSLLPVGASAAETEEAKIELPMMTGITVDYNDSGNIVFIWSPVSGATGYEISRADTQEASEAGEYKLLTYTSSCVFTDTTTSPGQYYYYKLVAVDKNGIYASSQPVEGPALALYAKPVNAGGTLKKGLLGNQKTNIDWDKVSGVDAYIILRGTTSDLNSMEPLSGTLLTSYTDSGWYDGYYYCIIGVKNMGDDVDPVPTVPAIIYVSSCSHSYNNVVTAPTCSARGYTTHTCTKCGYSYVDSYTDPVEHSFSIWLQIKEASCTKEGYEVHYCNNCSASEARPLAKLTHNYENGVCKLCGEKTPTPVLSVTSSAGKPKLTWEAIDGADKYYIYRSTDGKSFSYLASTTKTSYTNSTAKIGTTYYYKIVAVFGSTKTPYSNIVSKQCVPAAPSLTVARSSGKAKLSWDKVTGASKYYIYRSTDGKTYKYYTSTTGTTYTDSKASSGTKYYYKVKAIAVVSGKTVYSSYSSAKSLVTTLAAPSVSITTSSGKPKLSWSKVTGADKYYIYRSTDGKSFTYLTSTTKTSYTNTDAAKNTKYYYKVKAVSSASSAASSAQSKTVSIKATK